MKALRQPFDRPNHPLPSDRPGTQGLGCGLPGLGDRGHQRTGGAGGGLSCVQTRKGPDGKADTVRVSGRYVCDNWEVLREWALAGLGVALKSTWDVRRHLEDGSLVSLDHLEGAI